MEVQLTMPVTFEGESYKLHLFVDSIESDRNMGADLFWVGEIYRENGETEQLISVSEYPENSFTLIDVNDGFETESSAVIERLREFRSENMI